MSGANSYAVSYTNKVIGTGTDAAGNPAWDDVYKTDYVVLRRILPGTFVMGTNGTEQCATPNASLPVQVTLTHEYYLGVFEFTQAQMRRLVGEEKTATGQDFESRFTNADYWATRPTDFKAVRFGQLRGNGNWPEDRTVSANTVLAYFRSRTGGMMFDLPTSAQWEYACRAGTTTSWYDGTDATSADTSAALNALARYYGTTTDRTSNWSLDRNVGLEGATVPVGSYAPNAWGLYDMLGNVKEYCLDYYEETRGNSVPLVDPRGPASGTRHVTRGGGYSNRAKTMGAAVVDQGADIWAQAIDVGFRLCLTLGED